MDLDKDLKQFVEKQMTPIREKMLKEEQARYDEDVKRHKTRSEQLSDKGFSFKMQIVVVEAAILGAFAVFGQNISGLILLSLFTLILSMVFGVWSLRLEISSGFRLHQKESIDGLKFHWWKRELWKDPTVGEAKKMIEPSLETIKGDGKSEKLLKIFGLNADKVEGWFFRLLIASLFLIIISFITESKVFNFISNLSFVGFINNQDKVSDFSLIDFLIRLLEVFGILGATFFAAKSADAAKQALREMRLQNDPRIVVYVKQDEESLNILYLVIKNEGFESARDLSFEVSGDKIAILTNRTIADLPPIVDGVKILSGRKELVYPLQIAVGDTYKELKKSKCTIVATYYNNEEKKIFDRFDLDFRSLPDRKIGYGPNTKMLDVLRKIETNLSNIHSVLRGKLKGQ